MNDHVTQRNGIGEPSDYQRLGYYRDGSYCARSSSFCEGELFRARRGERIGDDRSFYSSDSYPVRLFSLQHHTPVLGRRSNDADRDGSRACGEYKRRQDDMCSMNFRDKSKAYGLLLMGLSAIVSAVTSLLIKTMANQGVSTFEIIFYQRLFQWLCNLLCLILYEIPFVMWWGYSGRHVFWLSLRGLFGFLALACGYWSVAHLTLSDAVVIRSFTPVVCGALSHVLLREGWLYLEIVASLTAMIGVWMALRCPSSLSSSFCYDAKDMVIALCAPLFAGAAFVALRKADQIHKTHPLVIVNFFAMFTVLLSLPMDVSLAHFRMHNSEASPPPAAAAAGAGEGEEGVFCGDDYVEPINANSFTITHWALIIFISLSAFVSQFLLTVGLQIERAAPASLVMLIGIPATFALQYTFVKCEPISAQSLTGGLILMMSIGAVGLQRFQASFSGNKILKEELLEKGPFSIVARQNIPPPSIGSSPRSAKAAAAAAE